MSGSRDWAACDAIVEDRNELSMLTFQAIEYLPAEQRWVAVGMAHEENKDVFKSYCRMTSETRWTDCTGGMFLSNGTSRLVKNSEGHLLQLNNIAEVTYNPVMLISHRTQALCRELMGTWKECGAGLSDLDMKFFFFMGASVTDNGEWILAGCQFPDDYGLGMPVSNAAHLTAVLTGSTWQVNKQIPDNTEACIMDIYRQ